MTDYTKAAPDDPNDPRTQSIDYENQLADLTLVRDVEEGETAIKGKRTEYLPQEPKESDKAYDIRLKRSGWWDGYQKCKSALVGMVFRKPPVFSEQLRPEVAALLDNIDLQGNHAAVFIKEAFAQAFDGHSFILVDMQIPLDPAVATMEDEKGRRPYWCLRSKDQIINWIEGTNAKGEIVPVQVTVYEQIKEQVGRFGEKLVHQWRVFAIESGILVCETHRLRETEGGKQEIYLHNIVTAPKIDFIPAIAIHTKRTGFWKSRPVLLGLARLMLMHFRGWSDLNNILHKCMVPILVFFGREEPDKDVEVGPNAGLDMPQDGAVEWKEPAGSAIALGQASQKDIERLAGSVGLELLAPRSDVEVTAFQSAVDDSSQTSELGGMAQGLDDAINQALYFTARFLGLEDAGTTPDESALFTVNKDFTRLQLDSAMIATASNLVLSGQMPVDWLFWLMGRGEMLPPDYTPEKYKQLIGEFALLNPRPEPGADDPAKAAA